MIRKLRVTFGWTLADLQRKSGVDPTTINKIELGKTREADRSTLQKIAAAFGLTLTQFLDAIPAQGIALPLRAEALYLAKGVVRQVERHEAGRKPKRTKGKEIASR